MLTLILIALAGAAANLVDGGIGMGFGVTSTTMLLLAGLGPAQASAVVHTAELGTTAISGLSHARFGNVDWKTVVRLGVPGGIAAASGDDLAKLADGWADLARCGQDLFAEVMDVLVAEAWRLAPRATTSRARAALSATPQQQFVLSSGGKTKH